MIDLGIDMGKRRAKEKTVAQKAWPQKSLTKMFGSWSSVQKRSKIVGSIDLI